MTDEMAIFDQARIRHIWHADELWFSVIDVITVLTESATARKYWNTLKTRLAAEGAGEVSSKCRQLKLPAADGKLRATDCATSETLLRIVQSVPSPRAEPFKRWLAQVGQARIEEANEPEEGFTEWRRRAVLSYMAQGYSEAWAHNRIDSIVTFNELTHEWSVRDIDSRDFPVLIDRLHMRSFGLSTQAHEDVKEFPVVFRGGRAVHKGNLPKSMTASELAVRVTAQATARALHVDRDSHGIAEITRDVDDAGDIAAKQRREIERLTGKPVVSSRDMAIERDGGLWAELPEPE